MYIDISQYFFVAFFIGVLGLFLFSVGGASGVAGAPAASKAEQRSRLIADPRAAEHHLFVTGAVEQGLERAVLGDVIEHGRPHLPCCQIHGRAASAAPPVAPLQQTPMD